MDNKTKILLGMNLTLTKGGPNADETEAGQLALDIIDDPDM